MRVLIAGIDGYLGWPLAQHLRARGHEVAGIDSLLRRRCVAEMGSDTALPIAAPGERAAYAAERFGGSLSLVEGDLLDADLVARLLADFQPEAIVHLGELPSAPYSMIDVKHAALTQNNNVVGTLNLLFAMRDTTPAAHLVKLGTMGEYGTPNLDIPEGFFEVEYRGRRDKLPFPRQAGSWYHLSKVHDSANVLFACRVWGLRSTDVMQGVVYGTRIDALDPGDARSRTRLDFDQCFGTALNRFCAQAVIGEPMTVFGSGGQKRGFLALRDSIQCLTIAIENPPPRGEYRVLNQFEEVYDVASLAEQVRAVAASLGLDPRVERFENPRTEAERHHYNPDHGTLFELGYAPTRDMAGELRQMLEDLLPHAERIARHRSVLVPDIHWSGARERVHRLTAPPAAGNGRAQRADAAAAGAGPVAHAIGGSEPQPRGGGR